jgi:N-acetylglucosamine-6-phosphate deacetylase
VHQQIVGRDPVSSRVLRVVVEGGVISHITDEQDDPGCWLSPGLIDLQVNGYRTLDFNRPNLTDVDVANLVAGLRATGVTTVVPTLITAPEERLGQALSAIAEARRTSAAVAHAIPCVHVEGPSLSPEIGPRGVHDPAFMRPPDIAEVRRWQEAGDGLVGVVTISPHWPDSEAFISQAVAMGIRVAVGHTHASSEQVHAAVDAGATLSTHLGNGAHARLARHPNYIWAQLADDRLRCGLIADGHHLSADTFKVMLRALGPDRAHLVSDCTEMAGRPPGNYRTSVGGAVRLSADGRLTAADSDFLAGAARTLNESVATATALADIPIGTAIQLATRNPARLLPDRAGERGVLRAGAAADLFTFTYSAGDRRLEVQEVVTHGVTFPGGPSASMIGDAPVTHAGPLPRCVIRGPDEGRT